jgi:nucleotide-binding universal stress UspA family protein
VNVLLPVDRSEASVKAVEFAARILAAMKGQARVTVLHVAESIPDFLLAGRSAGKASDIYRQVVEDWEKDQESTGAALLDRHRKSLVAAGVPETSIETRLVVRESRPESRKVVAALCIIEEMKRGDYTLVCLGRRGLTAAAGSFLGSVAEKVLREAEGLTVCVVD